MYIKCQKKKGNQNSKQMDNINVTFVIFQLVEQNH